MVPLHLIILFLQIVLVARQVVSVLLVVLLVLANMPLSRIEVILGDDTKVITP